MHITGKKPFKITANKFENISSQSRTRWNTARGQYFSSLLKTNSTSLTHITLLTFKL